MNEPELGQSVLDAPQSKIRNLLNIEKQNAIEDIRRVLYMYTHNILNHIEITGNVLMYSFLALRAAEIVHPPPEPFVEQTLDIMYKDIKARLNDPKELEPYIEKAKINVRLLNEAENRIKEEVNKAKTPTPGIT